MPTDVVELREITNVGGDPEVNYGSTGGTNVVLPFSQGIQYVAQAARMKADADQFKYNQFQQNMKDFYTRFNDINVDGIMEADYPIINEEYATLAKDIADNYDVIRNPNINPEKFAELKEKEAKLRGNISRSKQELAYRDFNNQFLKSQPSFNTVENQKKIAEFNSKPLGERQLFNLETPFAYNPSERAKIANGIAQAKLKEEKVKGKYITNEESIMYLEKEFDNAWDALGGMQDNTGRPVIQAAQDTFNKLPQHLTKGVDFQTFDRQMGRNLMYQDEFVRSMRPDPFALQDDAQKHDAAEGAAERATRRYIAQLRGDERDVDAAGRDYNEAITSGYTTGYVRPELLQSVFGDNAEITTKKVTGQGAVDESGNPLPVTTVEIKVPKVQATGSRLDAQGRLVVSRIDNSTGKALPDLVVPYEEGREVFKNIAGTKNSGLVADAAEKYRRKYGLGVNPELPVLKKHFNLGGDDMNLSDAEYWRKHEKAKPKQ